MLRWTDGEWEAKHRLVLNDEIIEGFDIANEQPGPRLKVWEARPNTVVAYIVDLAGLEQQKKPLRDWVLQQLQHCQKAIHKYNQDNQPEGPVWWCHRLGWPHWTSPLAWACPAPGRAVRRPGRSH